MNSSKVFQGESARTTRPYLVQAVLHDEAEVLQRIVGNRLQVRNAAEIGGGRIEYRVAVGFLGFYPASTRVPAAPTTLLTTIGCLRILAASAARARIDRSVDRPPDSPRAG